MATQLVNRGWGKKRRQLPNYRIGIIAFSSVVRKGAVRSGCQGRTRGDGVEGGIDTVVIANIELVLLTEIEVITHQKNFRVVGLGIGSFLVK